MFATPPLAAIGYSILYLLFGGGLGGAVPHLHCRENAGRLITSRRVRTLGVPWPAVSTGRTRRAGPKAAGLVRWRTGRHLVCRRRRARGQLPEIYSAFPVSCDAFAEPKPTFDSAPTVQLIAGKLQLHGDGERRLVEAKPGRERVVARPAAAGRHGLLGQLAPRRTALFATLRDRRQCAASEPAIRATSVTGPSLPSLSSVMASSFCSFAGNT